MKEITLFLLISFTLLLVSLALASKKWKHNQLGYGYPNGMKEKDEYGFQDTYKCQFCEGKITKDSNGDWFHLSN